MSLPFSAIPAAIGIDVGKKQLHICVANTNDNNPKAIARWTVHVVDYEDPLWYQRLLALVPVGGVVALEPTGYHLIAPIITVLKTWQPTATIYQVSGATTGQIRKLFISSSKTDHMDARALAYIAGKIIAQTPPRTAVLLEPELEQHLQHLRLYVNAHVRLTKQTTRIKNQLSALGHGIFPQLNIKRTTWLRCVALGAVTPIEIHALVNNRSAYPELQDGRGFKFVEALANALPPIDGDSAIRDAIINLAHTLQSTEAELVITAEHITRLVEHPALIDVTNRWRTAPNIGDYGIAALHIASNGKAHELERDQFVAAVGCAPATSRSGDQQRDAAATIGYRPAKTTLHLLTQTLLKETSRPNIVADYFDTTTSQRRLAATRRKLASILSGIARSNEGWRY